MYRILLLDDEPNVLQALRRDLGKEYEVEVFSAPAEALARAAEAPFDLVLADYLMPGMDGVTFLQAVARLQPSAVRVLLSGRVDMEALGRAVNEAHIYRFLEKPWEPGCLRIDIAQALEWRRVLEENRRLAERYRAQHGESSPPVPAGDYRVLVVDDEEGVLNAVWRELTHHSAYEGLYAALRRDLTHRSVVDTHPVHFVVDTSLSPLDALHRAEEIPYDVVVADYRMPEMDGVAFLEAFRRVQPDAVAVMLSGHADLAALSAAVNRADIRHFVRKPWSEYELKNALIQALGWREVVLENRRLSEALK